MTRPFSSSHKPLICRTTVWSIPYYSVLHTLYCISVIALDHRSSPPITVLCYYCLPPSTTPSHSTPHLIPISVPLRGGLQLASPIVDSLVRGTAQRFHSPALFLFLFFSFFFIYIFPFSIFLPLLASLVRLLTHKTMSPPPPNGPTLTKLNSIFPLWLHDPRIPRSSACAEALLSFHISS